MLNSKIKEMNQYLQEHLVLNNNKIIFNTNYDQENGFWVLQGYVDKPIMDRQKPTIRYCLFYNRRKT